MDGMLGRKLGMTQIFTDDGTAIPVTVIKAGPCLVVQRKTTEHDGYEAVQLGFVEERPPKRVNRPMQGHFKRAGVAPTRRLAEFLLDEGEDAQPGQQVRASIFSVEELVDVQGTSKGKGFQGVVRRHGFAGGRATHGSMFHRAPGSIGQSSYPSRVFPGMRGAGQMGNERVTVKNLKIVKIDEERNHIFLQGAVPGPRNGYVVLRRAKRG